MSRPLTIDRLSSNQRIALVASIERAPEGHRAHGVIIRGGIGRYSSRDRAHWLTIAGINRLCTLGLIGDVRSSDGTNGKITSVRLNDVGVALARGIQREMREVAEQEAARIDRAARATDEAHEAPSR